MMISLKYPHLLLIIGMSIVPLLFIGWRWWGYRFLEYCIIRRLPLSVWLTTRDAKIVARSQRAVQLLGAHQTPQGLKSMVVQEDIYLTDYLIHTDKTLVPHVDRHVSLKLTTQDVLRVFQGTYGPWVLWIFNKKTRFLPYLHPRQQTHYMDHHAQEALRNAPYGCILIDAEGRVLDSNQVVKNWLMTIKTKRTSRAALQQSVHLSTYFTPATQPDIESFLLQLMEGSLKNEAYTRNKAVFEGPEGRLIRLSGVRLATLHSRPIYVVYCFDSSWETTLQASFTHTHKMQALGQLSGSIAHDFNNILTGIIGFADILLTKFMPGDWAFTEIVQIKQNGFRGANLVRQLLSFSKHQPLNVRALDPTHHISEMVPLFERLLGNSITLKYAIGRNIAGILVDQSQFEQILMNLVVNARDAIGDTEGVVGIYLKRRMLKTHLRTSQDIIPAGDYIQLEVTDTGCGIEPHVIDKIFDPFFTSKEASKVVGSGAGLGLATVYSVMQQAKGFIQVESLLHQGTTFRLFWPYVELPVVLSPWDSEGLSALGQSPLAVNGAGDPSSLKDLKTKSKASIFLVEDDDAVRYFTQKALTNKGYIVRSFASGALALEALKATLDTPNPEPPTLVITDVIMPGISGPTMATQMAELIQPKFLFISGFSDAQLDTLPINPAHLYFLPKPYDMKTLIAKVNAIVLEKEPKIP